MPSIRVPFLAFAAIAAVLAAAPPSTLAQAPSAAAARLSYVRGPGAEECPDEQELRDAVAALLGGRDPFAPNGAKRMDVTIVRPDRDFVGHVTLYGEDGGLIGEQEHANAACTTLVQKIGASIAIALGSYVPPTDPSPPVALVAAPPPALPPPRPHPPPGPDATPPPARGLRLQVGAGAALGGGFAPALSVGFGGLIGARWPAASLSVDVRADLPASTEPTANAAFRTSWLGASLVPCGHVRWFLACGLVSAGRVSSAATGNTMPADGTAGYLGFGGRVGLEAPFSSRVAGQITADVLVNALRPTIRLEGDAVWSVATVSELAALRLVTFF
jgi:hypothetical protein